MTEKTDDGKTAENGETDQKESPENRKMSKTPMFTAMHWARYQRQNLIREIDEGGTTLLCYVGGIGTQIDRDDVIGFADLLHNVSLGDSVDLLLHTPGGDIDAAEKLITMLRSAVGGEGNLRFIVPDHAKSAGTLMALGANSILMSDSSELGPIDPQIWLKDGRDNDICHSVLHYLKAYEECELQLRKNSNDHVAQLLLDKFDPWILHKFRAVKDRARVVAENQLMRRGMNFSKITAELMNIDKWKSHGQMIGWQDATEIGLPIEYLANFDEKWQKYWQLYCLQRLEQVRIDANRDW